MTSRSAPRRKTGSAVVAFLSLLTGASAQADLASVPDPALPSYAPVPVSLPTDSPYLTRAGAIRLGGAEHTRFLLERATALFLQTHPGLTLVDESTGASSTLPLLTYGKLLIGSIGRPVTPLETAAFKRVVGTAPIEIRIAHAANDTSQHLATSLAVYVNRDNPLERLTTEQVSQMISVGNAHGDYSRWGQLGLKGAWAERLIHPIGTPEYTGFGIWMQSNQLAGRSYSAAYEEYGSTDEILTRLENEPGGIAVAAIGRETKHIKQVAVATRAGGPFVTGTAAQVQADAYPYGRYLYFYLRRPPGAPIDPVAKEYLRLLLSREGQAMLAAQPNGYIPLTAAEAAVERAKLNQ